MVLDRTAFYPEGGGQPGDRGTLNDVTVSDTQERGEEIIHLTDQPLEVGAAVTGRLDWPHRFSLMQNHSGEHLVSGIIHRRTGGNNVGFHMGIDTITVDLDVELTAAELAEIEAEANRAVWANGVTQIFHPTAAELKELDYRSKKELSGDVRIVTCPGADTCACCGTHVSRTGEIGLIKPVSYTHLDGYKRQALARRGVRANWSRRENLHLTLEFLGEVRDTAPVVEAMERVKAHKFSICFTDTGRFRRDGGDIFWLGVARTEPLMLLQAQLHEALRREAVSYTHL